METNSYLTAPNYCYQYIFILSIIETGRIKKVAQVSLVNFQVLSLAPIGSLEAMGDNELRQGIGEFFLPEGLKVFSLHSLSMDV